MAEINPRVLARIDLMRAQAVDGLSRLESYERSSTTLGGRRGSGPGRAQLARAKAITELRDQVKAWTWILAVARHETDVVRFEDALDVDKEFPAEHPAPEHTIAWRGVHPGSVTSGEDVPDVIVCAVGLFGGCRWAFAGRIWTRLTASTVPAGTLCARCEKDVLE